LKEELASIREKEPVLAELDKALGNTNGKSSHAQLEKLAKKAAAAEGAMTALGDYGLLKSPDEDLSAAVKRVGAELNHVRQAAAEAGLSPDRFSLLADRLDESSRDLKNCHGSLANMQQRFAEIGRGTENPACWADPSGHVQYIFDIALTSAGVIVRQNQVVGREEDQLKLPMRGIEFEKEVSTAAFLTETGALYEYGQDRKILNVPCRFFVRVYDETKPDEKEIYKSHLDAVEAHFYKLKVRNGHFSDSIRGSLGSEAQ
jgi:hypothetical protein